MRKIILSLSLSFLIMFTATGCSSDIRSQENESVSQSHTNIEINKPIETQMPELNDTFTDIIEEPPRTGESYAYNFDEDLAAEAYGEAYATFLRGFPVNTDYSHSQFSWRDLDDNGVPELIIEQANADGGVLSVYSYDGIVYKIGDYSNSKIGVTNLRFSNNPEFYGLFTLWWGGGVEHYGYLNVNKGTLIYEDLWYIDRSKESPFQNEISNDKQLINESINVYKSDESADNLLKMYPINEDGIVEIIR